MKKITALKAQKRNANRVNVYLDGEFAFGLSRVVAAWLKIGQRLTPEKVQQLKEQDAEEIALQRALHFLSFRPRSAKEVTDNLRKHETPESVIEKILDRLNNNGVIDDLQFARTWLENRSEFRPRGAYALRAELRQKGISDQIIAQALEGLEELPLAHKAGSTRASKLKTTDEREFKRKMFGYLSRRGFDFETIKQVVTKLWQEKQAL